MRSVWQANRNIVNQIRNGVQFPSGWCKRKCRQAYDIPSDGTRNAKEAYARTDHRFTGMWIPGAFAWWRNNGVWHVAICQYRKGWVFSVDVDDNDPTAERRWNTLPLTDVHKRWPSCTFVGFSRDIDGMTPVKIPRIVRRYP